jgi:hypothetical protein
MTAQLAELAHKDAEIERLQKRVERLQELAYAPDGKEYRSMVFDMADVLHRSGFVRCDIPACNCGSWHQVGGFKLRFDEIKDAVEDAGYSTGGRTLLDAVKEMAGERERCVTIALEQRCERGTPWDRACVTIAEFIRASRPVKTAE